MFGMYEKEVIELILRYDDDKEVSNLVRDLEISLGIHIGLGRGHKKVEFTLWGHNCKEKDYHGAYHIGEGKLRDLLLDTADDIREWTEDSQYQYESFIECFGAENRRKFVKLVDKNLSE